MSICSFAQFPILSDSLIKPGVYKSFEEFRDNNPSQKLAGETIEMGNNNFEIKNIF